VTEIPPRTVTTSQGGRSRAWLGRWWILLLFLAAQAPFLLQPIGGLHKWRQADTAAVARNLAFESADPLHPRIDMRGDRSGITGMEFPLYQLAVAAGMRLAGDRDAVGRIISLVAATLAWLSLAALLERRFAVGRTSAHAAIALSPLLFLYAAKVMPETTALALACVAVERTDAWLTSRRGRDLALGAAGLALAALTRPYLVFAGVPLLLAWVDRLRRDPLGRPRPLGWDAALAGALAALPFLMWYSAWCPHLVRTHGIDYFFTGRPLTHNLRELAEWRLWATLGASLGQHVANWVALPLVVVGAWLLRHAAPPARWIAYGIPAVAIPALLLLIGGHFSPHHYYFMVLCIPAAACCAVAIDACARRWPRATNAMLPLLLVASLAQWSHGWRADRDWLAYGPLLAAGGLPGPGLAAVEDGGHVAWHLHPLRARGWIASRAALDDPRTVAALRRAGLAWVVWRDESGVYHATAAAAWRPPGTTGVPSVFPPEDIADEPHPGGARSRSSRSRGSQEARPERTSGSSSWATRLRSLSKSWTVRGAPASPK